jgi:hypothetical protein
VYRDIQKKQLFGPNNAALKQLQDKNAAAKLLRKGLLCWYFRRIQQLNGGSDGPLRAQRLKLGIVLYVPAWRQRQVGRFGLV